MSKNSNMMNESLNRSQSESKSLQDLKLFLITLLPPGVPLLIDLTGNCSLKLDPAVGVVEVGDLSHVL